MGNDGTHRRHRPRLLTPGTASLPPTQAWIDDTQATAPPARTEDDDDLIHSKAKGAEPEDNSALSTSPGGGAMVSVVGAKFVVGDSGYMTL